MEKIIRRTAIAGLSSLFIWEEAIGAKEHISVLELTLLHSKVEIFKRVSTFASIMNLINVDEVHYLNSS